MPVNKCIGVSDATIHKQQHYEGLLNILLNIHKGVRRKHHYANNEPFFILDMNAGNGTGSTKIAIESAAKCRFPVKMIFVEKDKENFQQLEKNTRSLLQQLNHDQLISVEMFNVDNRDIDKYFNEDVRSKMRLCGLIYHDPNGVPCTDTLAELSLLPSAKKLDIIINCNATAIKRTDSVFGYPCLCKRLSMIPKKSWIIREPIGRWQWSLLVGMNWNTPPEWKSKGFFNIDSDDGRRIFRRLNCTAEKLDGIQCQVEECEDSESSTANTGQFCFNFLEA